LVGWSVGRLVGWLVGWFVHLLAASRLVCSLGLWLVGMLILAARQAAVTKQRNQISYLAVCSLVAGLIGLVLCCFGCFVGWLLMLVMRFMICLTWVLGRVVSTCINQTKHINQSTNQQTNQPLNQQANQPSNQPTNQQTTSPTEA
jgi:hypothetical protein